ncbi:hypothetical protein [Mesorhizobium sp. 1B3]|uniref:hypothetical protein n=1 Tax=Mesorhizobium sp. 1B3 TaxID=3243599 RepID=UPI003D9670E8
MLSGGKFEAYFTSRDLIDHAVSSIDAADCFSEPFPHIFFENFFPREFYTRMLKAFPSEGYSSIARNGTRLELPLYDGHIDKIDGGLRGIWQAVSETLTSAEVENAIRRQLRTGLEIRARGDRVAGPDALTMVARPVLYVDKDGYKINPHPDTRKKVVTMQLYCPTDESQRELGTTLYQASLKGLLHVGSYGLEPVKTFPFLPNVGYAFVVLKARHSPTGMSWHGRPTIKTTSDQPRLSILNTYYVNETLKP